MPVNKKIWNIISKFSKILLSIECQGRYILWAKFNIISGVEKIKHFDEVSCKQQTVSFATS